MQKCCHQAVAKRHDTTFMSIHTQGSKSIDGRCVGKKNVLIELAVYSSSDQKDMCDG